MKEDEKIIAVASTHSTEENIAKEIVVFPREVVRNIEILEPSERLQERLGVNLKNPLKIQ